MLKRRRLLIYLAFLVCFSFIASCSSNKKPLTSDSPQNGQPPTQSPPVNPQPTPIPSPTATYSPPQGSFCSRNPLVISLVEMELQKQCSALSLIDLESIRNMTLPTNFDVLDIKFRKDDFQDLPSLHIIHFSGIKIRDGALPVGLFRGLSNLRWLNLANSGLKNIRPGLFKDLGGLDTLELQDNQLTTIVSGTFIGLDNLKFLVLRGNQISQFEAGAFLGLPHLQILHMQGNSLSQDWKARLKKEVGNDVKIYY